LVNQNYYSYCCIADYLFLSRESVTVTKNVFFFRDKLRRLKLTRSLCQPTHIYPFILHIICANLSNLYPPFRWHSGSVRGRIHPHRTAAASEGRPLRHSLLYCCVGHCRKSVLLENYAFKVDYFRKCRRNPATKLHSSGRT
jgi:hypothetical protein